MDKKPGFSIIEALVILAVILMAGATAYLLGVQQTSQKSPPSPASHPSPTPTPKPQPTPSLPDGWSYQISSGCHVDLPVPPHQSPYIGTGSWLGAYWKFTDSPISNRSTDDPIAQLLPQGAGVTFAPDEGATEAGAWVEIACGTITQQYALDRFTQQYKQAHDQSTPTDSLTRQQSLTLWGQQITQLTFASGVHEGVSYSRYLAVSGDRYYVVSKYPETPSASSESPAISQTLPTIWKNIHFD